MDEKEAIKVLNSGIDIKNYILDNITGGGEIHSALMLCPLHDESTPSFKIYENTNTFHCFGCGQNGGVFYLHYALRKREMGKYSLTRAIHDLSSMYNIDIDKVESQEIPKEKIAEKTKFKKIVYELDEAIKKEKDRDKAMAQIADLVDAVAIRDSEEAEDTFDKLYNSVISET